MSVFANIDQLRKFLNNIEVDGAHVRQISVGITESVLFYSVLFSIIIKF